MSAISTASPTREVCTKERAPEATVTDRRVPWQKLTLPGSGFLRSDQMD
jgi:hypothetical protein